MSKFCMKCGSELEDDAAFCDDCGAQQVMADTTTSPEHIPQPLHSAASSGHIPQPNTMAVPPETKTKQSGLGIAALILGIVSFFTIGILIIPEILGIIFGIVALLDKSKKTGFALTGLILSIISTLLFILLLFI